MGIIEELELQKPSPDDRIVCDDCHNFKVKKWGGRCGANEVFYVGLKHRCPKSVVFIQHIAADKTPLKQNNLWEEGQKPFWE